MFSYYTSQSRYIKSFPRPLFDTIVEPFAGSARYALLYFDRDITLIDRYKVITDIWKYLIQASKKDILSLPPIAPAQKLLLPELCTPAANLVRFCANRGTPKPAMTAGTYKGMADYWEYKKVSIAESLFKIRHWKVIQGDYRKAPDVTATWFIDAPYQHTRTTHIYQHIHYRQLARWCQERKGQVLVCENNKATWLPFQRLLTAKGQRSQSHHTCIWSNYLYHLQANQIALF